MRKNPDIHVSSGTFKEWHLWVMWSKEQLQTNYQLGQPYQSVNKNLRLHSSRQSEVKTRADTRLLQNTLRMECIVTCMHLIQLRYVRRYIFMSGPEWAQSHEISSASKGHGGMALIVHYFG